MNHLTSNYPAVLSTSVTVAVTVALLAVVYLYFVNGKKGHYGLFPSPPAHPIWGHAAILIAPFQWKAFAEMGKELGKHIAIIKDPMQTCFGREHHISLSFRSIYHCAQFRRGCARAHGKAWREVLWSCWDNTVWGDARFHNICFTMLVANVNLGMDSRTRLLFSRMATSCVHNDA